MRSYRILLPALVALAASPAFGQDFGVAWIDRVTHELEAEQAPLPRQPATFRASGGQLYYFDSNIYLHGTAESDSILVPWVRARLDYSEPNFDAAADLLANYKLYTSATGASSDEERFFGRARYAGTRLSFEMAEILRRESDPTDITLLDRADRLVSNTFPSVNVDITDKLSTHLGANVQFVQFADAPFTNANNVNYRADVGASYQIDSRYGAGLQFGFLAIDYSNAASVDSTGFYVRGGCSGTPTQTLSFDLFVGMSSITSGVVPLTGEAISQTNLDVDLHGRYEATQTFTLSVDYARRFGFATGPNPFQFVDRFGLGAEYDINDVATVEGTVKYEMATTALETDRSFFSFSAAGSYKFTSFLIGEAGLTFRTGSSTSTSSEGFTGIVFHVGVGLTY